MKDKHRLGRGLEALMSEAHVNDTPEAAITARVGLDVIQPNPHQPRKTFDEDELARLSDSIREHGLLQPLVVRKAGDSYEIIAGERRWRAARQAGLAEVPVHVVDFNDQQVFEAALVENIQRADLNPIEKAQGFRDYLERFQMTHDALAKKLGLDRSTITNLLGLLNLPGEVQDFVRVGQLSLGHAKVLKGLTDPQEQISLARDVIARTLSVHALEQLVKQKRTEQPDGEKASPSRAAAVEKTNHVKAIEDELRQKLAVRVEIKLKSKHSGQVVLGFESSDDFERLIETLR